VIVAIALVPVALDFLTVVLRLRLRRDQGGSPERGRVIFVESIRWLSVRWGMRSVAAGLRRAGFAGEFVYWRWHAAWRGWLVVPAIADAPMLEREARRLAAAVLRALRERPGAPVYLIGYSCGGYLAVRALELLPAGVAVRSAALLAAAMDPRRDLTTARAHVAGPLVIASSLLDWLIVGAGTLLFGTADRKHTPSVGMVGLRGSRAAPPDGVVELRWRPGLIRLGNLGGHFSASAAAFIERAVAPAMGLPGRPTERSSER